jgi:hypothetical protein
MKTEMQILCGLMSEKHPDKGWVLHGSIDDVKDLTGLSLEDGGDVKLTYADVVAKRAELIAAEPMRLLREKRNRFLAESDWWASSDLVMSDERNAYRQALRDLPKGLTTPTKVKNVTWPTKPE